MTTEVLPIIDKPCSFHVWRFDPADGTVVSANEKHRLQPRLSKLLAIFLANSGQLLTREQLIDALWQDKMVNEDALSRCIAELRSTLGDSSSNPVYIETVPKRGYRLIAQVTWLEQGVGETGRYRLQERVGGGAMGIVFRGEDTRLGRQVALKFLPPQASDNQEAKDRFFREADAQKDTLYDTVSRYPHVAVCAFVNWPTEIASHSPATVLPHCYRDSSCGFYAWRNRWQDDVLRHKHLVLTSAAVDALKERLER